MPITNETNYQLDIPYNLNSNEYNNNSNTNIQVHHMISKVEFLSDVSVKILYFNARSI